MAGHVRVTMPQRWASAAKEYEAWLKFRDLSPQSIELRMSHLKRFANATECGPYEATTGDVMVYLSANPWSKATLSSQRASLAVYFKWAVQAGKMHADPLLHIPRVKVPLGKPKPVTEEDFAAALSTADQRTRLALRLAGELGMRRGEVAKVHESDLIADPDGHLLKIIGKGNKERVIPVPASLADEIAAHIKTYGRNGWCFPSTEKPHGPLSAHWIGHLISKALPDGYTMHKLRHRALTQVYERTHDIVLTAGVAGHSSVNTTQAYYVAPNYSRMREALEGISG